MNADVKFNKGDEVFTQLLYLDQLRGFDSTGMLLVPKVSTDQPWVYKRAQNASDFISSRFYEKHLFGAVSRSKLIIGHNRSATRGNVCDHNAHPFQFGTYTVVHNGHISNALALTPIRETMEVDSMVVPRVLHEKGEIAGLESLEGAYALVWYNSVDNTLNMARNEARPMNFCYIKGHNTMVFGSEQGMLLAVLERNGYEIEDKFFNLTPGQLLKFNIDNPRAEYGKFPFSYAPPMHNTGTGGATMIGGVTTPRAAGNNWGYLPKGGTSLLKGGPDSVDGVDIRGTPAEGLPYLYAKKTLEYIDSLDQIPGKQKAQQCWAISNKKIKKAAVLAKDVKSYLGQEMQVELDSFVPYTKQQAKGRILAHRSLRDNTPVEILNCSQEDFDDWSKETFKYVKIVDAKEDRSKPGFVLGTVLIGIRIPKAAPRTLRGPNDTRLTTPEWLEAVKLGCAGCANLIFMAESENILWVGKESPVCPVCQADAKKMENLGLAMVLLNGAGDDGDDAGTVPQ